MIESKFKNIEILNRKFTQNVTDWGLKFVTFKMDIDKLKSSKNENIKFLNLNNRNIYASNNIETIFA